MRNVQRLHIELACAHHQLWADEGMFASCQNSAGRQRPSQGLGRQKTGRKKTIRQIRKISAMRLDGKVAPRAPSIEMAVGRGIVGKNERPEGRRRIDKTLPLCHSFLCLARGKVSSRELLVLPSRSSAMVCALRANIHRLPRVIRLVDTAYFLNDCYCLISVGIFLASDISPYAQLQRVASSPIVALRWRPLAPNFKCRP